MDRIVLDQKVDIGKEVVIKGPPLEALCFQGGRVGSLVTLTDSGGSDFRGRVTRLSGSEGSIFIFEAFPSPTESSLEIILFQALPEKERMELIFKKYGERVAVQKVLREWSWAIDDVLSPLFVRISVTYWVDLFIIDH